MLSHPELRNDSYTAVGGTATDYFSGMIDNKIGRVRSGMLPELTEQDCLDQQKLLPDVLDPRLDDAPFAVDHGDLGPLNILVDAENNITG